MEQKKPLYYVESKLNNSQPILGRFNFLKNLAHLDLQVTQRAASQLDTFALQLEQTPIDSILTTEQALKLTTEMDLIRNTLEAELKGFFAYVVTPKRFEVSKLLRDIGSIFTPGTLNKLPSLAQHDLGEAGKCIAFERPTAAAFHLLRATECVLRQYYCFKVRRNRVQLLWGPMIDGLKRRRDMKSQSSMLSNLDDMRITFRNPTQHPEKVYDIDEVQDLLGRCIDVISRIAKELP